MRRTDEPTDIQIRPTTGAVASSVQGGLAYLSDIERRLAPYFERAKPRQRAMAYLQGLRSPAERQNSWQVAEVIGDATPSGLQPVLRRAVWEPDAVRNELRAYVIEHLGALNAVLVIDATGFLKKGRHSAGVARQDRGTAGRIENGQIGVCVAYASPHGQVLLDRELSLPKAWADDRDRCRQVGIPEDRRCATTPQLAQRMRARAFAAGVPATWVTGDRVYGDDRRLRLWLESCPQAHVLAVSGKEYVWLNWPQRRVKTILATLPDEGWTRLRAGDGAKGPRWYAWRWRPLAEPLEPGWRRWLLVRRRLGDPSELPAYVVFAPQDTPLEAVVRVAGTRWTIARGFEAAKSEVGLDHDEGRRWTGWYRPMTLAMWALALLAVLRAGVSAVERLKQSPPCSPEPRSLAAFKVQRGLRSS